MYKHDHSKKFTNTARAAVTLCALAALGSGAVHAQATAFDPNGTAAQLGPNPVTGVFPMGDANGYLPSPTTINAGGDMIKFTAQGEPKSSTGFESATSNGSSTDFTPGTQLLNTFDGATHTITGPLQIDFSQAVTAFGFNAQDEASDQETFYFSLFNGATQLLPATGTSSEFTTGTFDNTATYDSKGNLVSGGKSVFVGAQATGGNVITRVVVRSVSNASGYTGSSNDFVVGPMSADPVPEASTAVSCGLGVFVFAGFVLGARKRRGACTPQAAV